MRAVIVAVGVLVAALGLAPAAGADPADDSCPLAMAFLCHYLPVAPGLDHNVVDLTQDPGALYGQPLPEPPGAEPVP
jgi:hypothetical protein